MLLFGKLIRHRPHKRGDGVRVLQCPNLTCRTEVCSSVSLQLKQFFIGEGCTTDGLLQPFVNRSYKSFEYATPPRGLFMVDSPLHSCIGKVLFYSLVVHQFHDFLCC